MSEMQKWRMFIAELSDTEIKEIYPGSFWKIKVLQDHYRYELNKHATGQTGTAPTVNEAMAQIKQHHAN